MTEPILPPASLHALALVALAAGDGPALTTFLAGLGSEPGIAVVLVPADHDGLSACAVALRAPAVRLRRVDATDGLALAADRIFVVPPGQLATFADGRIQLNRGGDGEGPGRVRVIDEALTDLAESHGEFGTAVFLAAAAAQADGGALALHDAGGLVLFQDESPVGPATDASRTARDGQLLRGQALPAAQLAPHLLARLAQRNQAAAPPPVSAEDLARVLSVVIAKTSVDFSDYKKSTLRRRIQRRMGIAQVQTADDYLALLNGTTEASVLHREMLIGVTRFFRDPEAFASLAEKVIAPLFAPGRTEPVRIWVAGCSTGEEAYTVAILVREAMAARGSELPVKIFATDLDRDAVDAAGIGAYPPEIADDLGAELLERYFVRRGDGFQVAKHVRELVVFAHHNIARDPPFFRMDLVTCRNLLIYLQPGLQRRLFNSFHFALGATGYLMLGTSETLGDMASYFAPVDAKWKIYRKVGERVPRMSESIFSDRLGGRARAAAPPGPDGPPLPAESLQEAIQQTLLTELVPAFLVADGAFDIHYTSGTVGRYLALPRGRPSFNLIRMAPRELGVALSTGIRRVLREGTAVVIDEVALRALGGPGAPPGRVRLSIRPLPQRAEFGNLVAVVFEEPDSARAGGQPFDLAAQTDQRIVDLETELDHSRESLQAAIEELETSNEELQATNEELLAANEELQSTNEELQSVNEELYTVNSEHQAKITELTELNDDILNLLGSSNIGTVFLDRRLCVRKFTRAATAQINLIDKDIGRPLAHLSNNIEYADLVADAQEVLATLIPKQRKVCTRGGQWHLMRILPYRTEDNIIKGVVITFIDIAEIVIAGEQVRALATTIEKTTSLVMITGQDGGIVYVNQRFVEVSGWDADAIIGRDPRFLSPGGEDAASAAELEGAMASGLVWAGRLRQQRRDGQPFSEEAVVVPLRDAQGRTASRIRIGSVVPGWTP